VVAQAVAEWQFGGPMQVCSVILDGDPTDALAMASANERYFL
jgi:hypothetical protein